MLTVELLDSILPTLYLTSELEDIKWSSVSDTDKLVLITKAEDFVSNISFENGAENEPNFETDLNKALCCIVYDYLNASNTHYADIKSGLKSYSGPDVSESYVDIKDFNIVSDSYKKYLWRYIYTGV